MDARKTTQGGGDEQNTENVVRLQRDWLGPREELVPMGSRAGTAEAADAPDTASLPPTAASFWDEDSGSLQAPMQAPSDAWDGEWEPASPQPPAVARSWHARLPRIPRLPRILSGDLAPPQRRRPAAVAAVLGAFLLLILAAIGETAGGTHNPGGTTATSSKSATIVTATGVNRARLKAHAPVVTAVRPEPRTHHADPSRRGRHPTRAFTRRTRPRSGSQPTPSASQPVHATTSTSPAPATSAPSTSSTSSASPSAQPASSSQHQPAFGSRGALGPGRSPDS